MLLLQQMPYHPDIEWLYCKYESCRCPENISLDCDIYYLLYVYLRELNHVALCPEEA